jgi:DNA/RNA endonuclease G (NUC1)
MGASQITIPTYYWKVLCTINPADNTVKTIGFRGMFLIGIHIVYIVHL